MFRKKKSDSYMPALTVHGSRVSTSPPASSCAMVALRLKEAGAPLAMDKDRDRDPRRVRFASPLTLLRAPPPPSDESSSLLTWAHTIQRNRHMEEYQQREKETGKWVVDCARTMADDDFA